MNSRFDVFNGDADGICALHQLRLEDPRPDAQLITGTKRDVKLLRYIAGEANAEVTVLDISMDSNRDFLRRLLGDSCQVLYIDHHFPGEIPDSSRLVAHIRTESDICTSLIVDQLLGGKYRAWAVVAAFGDNLHDTARKAAADLHWSEEQLGQARELGELMNYNGYGAKLEDLHFTPQELYQGVQSYDDPLVFYAESPVLEKLQGGFLADMSEARSREPFFVGNAGRVFRFPCESWSRRVAGVFSNEKAREKPDAAHALIVDNPDGTFLVSVRAPLNRKSGADGLCRSFPTGGGRAAAAGINALPKELLEKFLQSFEEVFSR